MSPGRRLRWPDPLWFVIVGLVISIAYPLLAGAGTLPSLPCHFASIVGFPCAMCGFGGAVIHLAGGDLLGAVLANPLAVISVLCGFGYLLYRALTSLLLPGRRRPSPCVQGGRSVLVFTGVFLVGVAVNWTYIIVSSSWAP